MTGWRRVLRQYPPECLITVPVVLGSFLWFALVYFGTPGTNGTGNVPARLLCLVVAHIALLAIPVAVWLVVRRDPWPERATALLIVAMLLGCVARGFVWGWLLYLTGVASEVEVLFRTTASLAQVTLAVGFLWLVTATVRRYAERRRNLLAEQERLVVLQSQAAAQLRQLDEEAAEQVRASVLEGLGHGEPARVDEVLRRIRLTLNDVVRPLSRQLESQGEAWSEPVTPVGDYRVRWWPTVKKAADPARIHPVLVTAMFELVALAIIPRYGLMVAVALAASVVLVLLPLLWIFRVVGMRLTRRAPAAVKALAFAAALAVPGVTLGRFDALYASWTNVVTPFPLAAPVYTALFGVIVAVTDSALRQARDVEAELKATDADLRWAIARAREQHRQHRLALAHAVHGRIQATLAAAILQLETALRQGEAPEELVEKVQKRLLDCVNGLDLRTTEPDPLPDLLRKVRATWNGATAIELLSGNGVQAALDHDRQCLTTLNDVVPELVFNAVRHGGADHIDITLSRPEPRVLELAVVDNGSGTADSVGTGLGTRLLDDCSITWSRQRCDPGSAATVLLPLLPA